MKPIRHHSHIRACESAAALWSLCSATYPKRNELLQNLACKSVFEELSVFALNARRLLELSNVKKKFVLDCHRWNWEPTTGMSLVSDFRDGLNRVVHSSSMQVGFESIPGDSALISGGAVGIIYILTETDRREKSYVDPFSLAHAFFYEVLQEFPPSGAESAFG